MKIHDLPKCHPIEGISSTGKNGFLNEIIGYLHSDLKKEKTFMRAKKKDTRIIDGELIYIGNKNFSKPIWGRKCIAYCDENDPSD